jgi:superfamily I DNA/RNA helicase
VFVIMLCDGMFPSARSMESEEGEEEERRLFYVAITRAKNELYLSYPLIRASFGNSGGDGNAAAVAFPRGNPPRPFERMEFETVLLNFSRPD